MGWGSMTVQRGGAGGGHRKLGLCEEGVVRSTQNTKRCPEPAICSAHGSYYCHYYSRYTGKWWRTGKPGMLKSMGSQRVRHKQLNNIVITKEILRDGRAACSHILWFQLHLQPHPLCVDSFLALSVQAVLLLFYSPGLSSASGERPMEAYLELSTCITSWGQPSASGGREPMDRSFSLSVLKGIILRGIFSLHSSSGIKPQFLTEMPSSTLHLILAFPPVPLACLLVSLLFHRRPFLRLCFQGYQSIRRLEKAALINRFPPRMNSNRDFVAGGKGSGDNPYMLWLHSY